METDRSTPDRSTQFSGQHNETAAEEGDDGEHMQRWYHVYKVVRPTSVRAEYSRSSRKLGILRPGALIPALEHRPGDTSSKGSTGAFPYNP